MKTIHILMIFTILLLSGCSKASQTSTAVEATGAVTAASTGSAEPSSANTFAYIPYWSGRIDSYSMDNGRMDKTGEVLASPLLCTPVSSPSGDFLYTFDKIRMLTRFRVAEDGKLTEPTKAQPKLLKQTVTDMCMHPSGRFVAIVTAGRRPESDGHIGGVTIVSVDSSNKFGSVIGSHETQFAVQEAVFAPAGDFLYIKSPRGILAYSVDATGRIAEKSVSKASLGSTLTMAVSEDGSRLVLGEEAEQSLIVWCTVQGDKITRAGAVQVSQESNYGITSSLDVGTSGNVATINANNWLACYAILDDKVAETATYLNFRDYKWRNKAEAEDYLTTTSAYASSLQDARDRPDWKNAAFLGAYSELGSVLATVRKAPDGNFYVSSSSGVYRFKSTPQGVVYDGPAITWPDTAHLFRGRTQVSGQQKKDAEQIADGMIFVQRK